MGGTHCLMSTLPYPTEITELTREGPKDSYLFAGGYDSAKASSSPPHGNWTCPRCRIHVVPSRTSSVACLETCPQCHQRRDRPLAEHSEASIASEDASDDYSSDVYSDEEGMYDDFTRFDDYGCHMDVCPYCGLQLPSRTLHAHMETCSIQTQQCPFCLRSVQAPEFHSHVLHCGGAASAGWRTHDLDGPDVHASELLEEQCPFCHHPVPAALIHEHVLSCGREDFLSMDDPLHNLGGEDVPLCPFCGLTVPAIGLYDHVLTCPSNPHKAHSSTSTPPWNCERGETPNPYGYDWDDQPHQDWSRTWRFHAESEAGHFASWMRGDRSSHLPPDPGRAAGRPWQDAGEEAGFPEGCAPPGRRSASTRPSAPASSSSGAEQQSGSGPTGRSSTGAADPVGSELPEIATIRKSLAGLNATALKGKLRQLQLQWHPDKAKGDPATVHTVFCYVQSEWEKAKQMT